MKFIEIPIEDLSYQEIIVNRIKPIQVLETKLGLVLIAQDYSEDNKERIRKVLKISRFLSNEALPMCDNQRDMMIAHIYTYLNSIDNQHITHWFWEVDYSMQQYTANSLAAHIRNLGKSLLVQVVQEILALSFHHFFKFLFKFLFKFFLFT